MRRSQIIVGNLLAGNGMSVVKRHNAGIRPEHWVFTQNVWPNGILWKRCLGEWHVIWLGVRPTFVKGRMPKGKILESEDLPHTILFNVLVLVHTTFPPLHQAAGVCVLDTLVCAGGHHAAEAALCMCALCIDVDYALHLRVIK